MASQDGDVQAFAGGKVRAAESFNLENQNKVEKEMEMKGSRCEI